MTQTYRVRSQFARCSLSPKVGDKGTGRKSRDLGTRAGSGIVDRTTITSARSVRPARTEHTNRQGLPGEAAQGVGLTTLSGEVRLHIQLLDFGVLLRDQALLNQGPRNRGAETATF